MFEHEPRVALEVLFLMSLVWAIPQIQMVGELSNTYPVNGGYAVWVTEALGPFFGCLESYWAWVGGVCDNVLFPVMIYQTLQKRWPEVLPDDAPGSDGEWKAYWMKVGLVALMAIPNMVSTLFAGKVLQLVCVMQGLVLTIFSLYCFTHHTEEHFSWILKKSPVARGEHDEPDKPRMMRAYFDVASAIFWKLGGWDSVSTIVGEIKDPRKNLVRALYITLVLVLIQYIAVFGSVAGFVHHERQEDGSAVVGWKSSTEGTGEGFKFTSELTDLDLPEWATKYTNTYFAVTLLAVSIFSNGGEFVSELLEDSYQLQGMAEKGVLPKWTKLHYLNPKFDTPMVAVAYSLVVFLILLPFPFSTLMAMSNVFTVLGCGLQMVAFFKFRVSHPDKKRPYRMHSFVLWLLMPLACIYGACILVFSVSVGPAEERPCTEDDYRFFLKMIIGIFVAGFPLAYVVTTRKKFRNEQEQITCEKC